MRRSIVISILSTFIIIFSISCNNDEPERLKIGMFVVGEGYNDAGYTENAKEGILMALAKTPFDTLFVSSVTYEQAEIDFLPENGCDIFFLSGVFGIDQTLTAAEKYPGTQFVIIDYQYKGALQNVQSIDYKIDEAAFPLGFLAAYWASFKDKIDPKVGIIGGVDSPVIQRFTTAYNLGISYFNNHYSQNVTVVSSILNSFDDSDLGYRVADSLINKCSADVIIPVAGKAGIGALSATKTNNKWAIGVDVDQYYSLPDVRDILLSSCTKRLDTTIYSVATTFLDNPVINSSTYIGTLQNQGVSLAPYHNFDTQIPDSIKAAIETIKTGIINGSIDTGF